MACIFSFLMQYHLIPKRMQFIIFPLVCFIDFQSETTCSNIQQLLKTQWYVALILIVQKYWMTGLPNNLK